VLSLSINVECDYKKTPSNFPCPASCILDHLNSPCMKL
jgi:hypothetical protein